MKLGRSLALVSAILAAATVAACAASPVESPQSENPTDSNARMVPSSEAAGSTEATADTSPAGTKAPGAPSVENPMRIEFAPDDNTANETGALPSGGIARYVLAGEAGQIMDATVESSQPPVVLSIVGADGSELQSVSTFAQEWSGALPTTQDYYLDLNAPTTGGSEYSLTVSLGE